MTLDVQISQANVHSFHNPFLKISPEEIILCREERGGVREKILST